MRLGIILFLLTLSAGQARAQIFSSEFFSDPVSEGWPLLQQYCGPILWNEDSAYHQQLGFDACPEDPPPGGGQDEYVVSVSEYNGVSRWFYEFRLTTNGDRSEIPGGAPTSFVAFNSFGESYGVNVARDQVKFYRDTLIPNVFVDVESGVPHTIRLELNNEETPTFKWFLDGQLIDAGMGEDFFPSDNARITWRGKAWFLPCENTWYYIRYGVIPIESSGDFDSDGDRDERDVFYLAECIADRGNGPNITAAPGCPWADMDADGDVDFADFGMFQRTFTGSNADADDGGGK